MYILANLRIPIILHSRICFLAKVSFESLDGEFINGLIIHALS